MTDAHEGGLNGASNGKAKAVRPPKRRAAAAPKFKEPTTIAEAAEQISAVAAETKADINAFIAAEAAPVAEPAAEPAAPAPASILPAADDEVEAALRAHFHDDPALIRAAAAETFAGMNAVADKIEGGAGVAKPPIEPAATLAVSPQATPAPQSFTMPTPPPNMMPFGESVWHWSPTTWNGLPLYAVLDRAIERVDQESGKPNPVRLVFVLLQPAYARNRAGRVVQLPEGARVIVMATTAWKDVVALASGPVGRPIVWACPLEAYALDGGGSEHGMIVLYDPSPDDPAKPRLIDLETVRGAKPETKVGP